MQAQLLVDAAPVGVSKDDIDELVTDDAIDRAVLDSGVPATTIDRGREDRTWQVARFPTEEHARVGDRLHVELSFAVRFVVHRRHGCRPGKS
ncbi:MAG TPA: hypothetical protein VFQ65_17115 [Kofleriaceae bacterium]|nr:hypothetical protein [Kofleriaceae bacterium]